MGNAPRAAPDGWRIYAGVGGYARRAEGFLRLRHSGAERTAYSFFCPAGLKPAPLKAFRATTRGVALTLQERA